MRIVAVVQCKSDTCMRDYLRFCECGCDANANAKRNRYEPKIRPEKQPKLEILSRQPNRRLCCDVVREGYSRPSLKFVTGLVTLLSSNIYPSIPSKPTVRVFRVLLAVLFPPQP